MLPTTIVLEIQRMLCADELSQRAIADLLGVSRGTVANIAHGRRGLREHAPPARYVRRSARHPRGLPMRCAHCGGLVYMPCLLCEARAFQARCSRLRRLLAAHQDRVAPPRRAA